MVKTERPWILVVVISLISTIIGYVIIFTMVRPKALQEVPDPEPKGYRSPDEYYFFVYYVRTYTRITPYLFGMLAAYYHRKDKDHALL